MDNCGTTVYTNITHAQALEQLRSLWIPSPFIEIDWDDNLRCSNDSHKFAPCIRCKDKRNYMALAVAFMDKDMQPVYWDWEDKGNIQIYLEPFIVPAPKDYWFDTTMYFWELGGWCIDMPPYGIAAWYPENGMPFDVRKYDTE